jgi:hypothetical protein
MTNFRKWLERSERISEGSNPGAKTGLYPLGYGGVGLYPPSWYPTRSADAIFYMTIDERIYKGKEGGSFDITHIPGECGTEMNSGEGGTWDISHIPGKPSHPPCKDYAAKNGEDEPWSIRHIKGGRDVSGPAYIPSSGERGMWDITHLKENSSDSILGMLSQELNLDPDDIIGLNTDDLGSDIKEKLKNLGVVKSTNDDMGRYGRIVRMIEDGVTISDLINAVG